MNDMLRRGSLGLGMLSVHRQKQGCRDFRLRNDRSVVALAPASRIRRRTRPVGPNELKKA